MNYAIPLWDAPCVPIAGTKDVFPVRHIYCVGRNYAEHAKEMGGDATKEPPFFFCKPADAVFPVVPPNVGSVRYPLATKNLHHEIELVVAIGKRGVRLRAEDANALVFGYATGLDMTRRDLQNDMREKKRPWDLGKSFSQAAPIAPIHAVAATGRFCHGDTPTLADICLVPQLANARRMNIDVGPYPTLTRIEAAAISLPAFVDAAPAKQPDAE